MSPAGWVLTAVLAFWMIVAWFSPSLFWVLICVGLTAILAAWWCDS